MAGRRVYDQYCPIAQGLDVLGERWTLLILRELLGGPRRYSDLRAELPGIATNLLAERLRDLEDDGLVERVELPPPAARTVYSLSDRGWREIPSVLQAVARFGASRLPAPPAHEAIHPLTGFLAGLLIAFDPHAARTADATYQVDVDGRTFAFAVRDGRLAPARTSAQVQLRATARDLVELRRDPSPARARQLAARLVFEGPPRAVARFCVTFDLPEPR